MTKREQVIKLFDSGVTETAEIARTLETSKGMVRVILSLAGRTPTRKWLWSEDEVRRLVLLRRAGKSFKEIALDLGRSPDGVKQRYYKTFS